MDASAGDELLAKRAEAGGEEEGEGFRGEVDDVQVGSARARARARRPELSHLVGRQDVGPGLGGTHQVGAAPTLGALEQGERGLVRRRGRGRARRGRDARRATRARRRRRDARSARARARAAWGASDDAETGGGHVVGRRVVTRAAEWRREVAVREDDACAERATLSSSADVSETTNALAPGHRHFRCGRRHVSTSAGRRRRGRRVRRTRGARNRRRGASTLDTLSHQRQPLRTPSSPSTHETSRGGHLVTSHPLSPPSPSSRRTTAAAECGPRR